jgi:hypothetical protein
VSAAYISVVRLIVNVPTVGPCSSAVSWALIETVGSLSMM